jgi:hypothetical protein
MTTNAVEVAMLAMVDQVRALFGDRPTVSATRAAEILGIDPDTLEAERAAGRAGVEEVAACPPRHGSASTACTTSARRSSAAV